MFKFILNIIELLVFFDRKCKIELLKSIFFLNVINVFLLNIYDWVVSVNSVLIEKFERLIIVLRIMG